MKNSTIASLRIVESQHGLQLDTIVAVVEDGGWMREVRPKVQEAVMAPNAAVSKELKVWAPDEYRRHYEYWQRRVEGTPVPSELKKWDRIKNHHPDQLTALKVLVL
jgi:hypothetical protein